MDSGRAPEHWSAAGENRRRGAKGSRHDIPNAKFWPCMPVGERADRRVTWNRVRPPRRDDSRDLPDGESRSDGRAISAGWRKLLRVGWRQEGAERRSGDGASSPRWSVRRVARPEGRLSRALLQLVLASVLDEGQNLTRAGRPRERPADWQLPKEKRRRSWSTSQGDDRLAAPKNQRSSPRSNQSPPRGGGWNKGAGGEGRRREGARVTRLAQELAEEPKGSHAARGRGWRSACWRFAKALASRIAAWRWTWTARSAGHVGGPWVLDPTAEAWTWRKRWPGGLLSRRTRHGSVPTTFVDAQTGPTVQLENALERTKPRRAPTWRSSPGQGAVVVRTDSRGEQSFEVGVPAAESGEPGRFETRRRKRARQRVTCGA